MNLKKNEGIFFMRNQNFFRSKIFKLFLSGARIYIFLLNNSLLLYKGKNSLHLKIKPRLMRQALPQVLDNEQGQHMEANACCVFHRTCGKTSSSCNFYVIFVTARRAWKITISYPVIYSTSDWKTNKWARVCYFD